MAHNDRSRRNKPKSTRRRQQTASNTASTGQSAFSLAPPPVTRTRSDRNVRQKVEKNTEDLLGLFGPSQGNQRVHVTPPPRLSPMPAPMSRQRSRSMSDENPFVTMASGAFGNDGTDNSLLTARARSDNDRQLDKERYEQLKNTPRGRALPRDTRYDTTDDHESDEPGFMSRLTDQFHTGIDEQVSGHNTYSRTGAAKQGLAMATQGTDMVVGNLARTTTITGAASAVHEAAIGGPHKGDRPRSNSSVRREKAAQTATLVGNGVGMIPVIGAVASAITGPAAVVQAREQGHSMRNALAIGAREAGASFLQGLAPGYGTYAGAVGIADAANQLATPVNQAGSDDYVHNMQQRSQAMQDLAANTQNPEVQRDAIRDARKTDNRIGKAQTILTEQGRGAEGPKRGLLRRNSDFE